MTKISNKKILIALSASLLLLAGCLASEKKLFPFGSWRLETPIKSGYYIYRQLNFTENGDKYLGGIETSNITLNRGQYRIYGGEDKTRLTPKDSDHEYIDFFTTYLNNTYIAQKNDDKNDLYYYLLVIKTDANSFYVEDKKCSNMKEVFVRNFAKAGIIYPNENKAKATCFFNDRAQLQDVLLADKNIWKSYENRYYEYANPQPVAPQELKKPPLFPFMAYGCSNDYPLIPKSYSQAFDQPTEMTGLHLEIISNLNYSGKSLGIEMVGNQTQNYAWLVWKEKCHPDYVIKILAIKPEKSVIKQSEIEPNLDKVKSACQLEKDNKFCGDLDSAIANYQAKGLKILLQGYQMLRFQDGKLAEGDLITIMGTEGEAKNMVLLNTNIKHAQGKGATRVLEEYGGSL